MAAATVAEVAADSGVDLSFLIGTMIELPRACVTAGEIAEAADFSFGTNDLTQTTWGFSRDDVEASFFTEYLENGIFGVSPFESLDVDGVGALVSTAVEQGREARRNSSSASAANTAVTRIRSTSSSPSDWTTCPAPRSGFRSPVWRLGASVHAGRAGGSDSR